jgi:hypothetical protein
MSEPGQLRELFRTEQALNERIGVRTDAMSEPEKTKWVLHYVRRNQINLRRQESGYARTDEAGSRHS